MKSRRSCRSWRTVAAIAALTAAAVPPLVVLPFRWLNPPASMLMLIRRAQGAARIDYRWIDAAQLPQHVPLALLAAEDQRFYEHLGIDLASLRDAVGGWQRGDRRRGASTITQQVAKNLFLWPDRSFVRKAVELYFALWLEVIWNKQRILEVYMNIAEFGPGVFGVEAAARAYLHKPSSQLTKADAALLAAVLPNPKRMHVTHPTAYVERRRTEILDDMEHLAAFFAAKAIRLPGRP